MTPAPDATSPASQVGMEGEARNETMTAGERAFTAWAASSKADATPLMWTWEEMPEEQRRRWANIAAAAAPAPIPAVQSGAVAWASKGTLESIRVGWRGEIAPNKTDEFSTPLYAAPQSEPLPGVRAVARTEGIEFTGGDYQRPDERYLGGLLNLEAITTLGPMRLVSFDAGGWTVTMVLDGEITVAGRVGFYTNGPANPFTPSELDHLLHLAEGGNGGTKPGAGFTAGDALALRVKLKRMT